MSIWDCHTQKLLFGGEAPQPIRYEPWRSTHHSWAPRPEQLSYFLLVAKAIVGAATSRPQRNGTACLVEWHAIRTHCRGGSQPPAFVPGPACSVEWYHVRHSTNSPDLDFYCGFVPRGRLRASPTVSSGRCTNSPNPVHHFWPVPHGRLIAAPTVAWALFFQSVGAHPIPGLGFHHLHAQVGEGVGVFRFQESQGNVGPLVRPFQPLQGPDPHPAGILGVHIG